VTAVTRIEIATRPGFADSRGLSIAASIRAHLGVAVGAVRTRDAFHVEPALSATDAARVAAEFAGPVVRHGAVGRIEDGPFDVAVSVGFKPGVTDPVGKSARVAIEDLLGRKLGPAGAVYGSRVYLLSGVSRADAARVATQLLANEVIERITVQSFAEWQASPPDLTVPRVVEHPPRPAETVRLRGLDDAALAGLSRRRLLALSVEELRTLRAFFEQAADDPARARAGLGADPTDVELECLDQTWSEHC
jgi:phosphoribosylformylglycinamidine (FGAM) synthase PurS component